MDSKQEDHYGMFLKVDLFLVNNAAALAFNPAIATTRTALNTLIQAIAQSDSTATRNLTGFTVAKNEHRAQQIAAFKLVRAGLMGYFVAHPDPGKAVIIEFLDSDIDKFRSAELYMRTDQVLDIALPIKTLLVPYGVADTDVDGLDTLNGAWQAIEPVNRIEEGVNKAARIDVNRFIDQVNDLLKNTLDKYMKVVQYTNPNLYSQYETARMIDDSGGGSDSEGYNVDTYTVPASGSLTVPLTPGPIPTNLDIYLRAINGDVYLCITMEPPTPCDPGSSYAMIHGHTFKGSVSDLGIGVADTIFQFTNTSLSDVVIRVGIAEA